MRRRQPAVAGTFYPGDERALESFVRPYADPARRGNDVRVLVGPHAGYIYSGGICGEGYAEVRVPGTVMVIGPNHTGLGASNAIVASGAFALPGGDLPIDEPLAQELMMRAGFVDDDVAHRREHSIEVHLPFLRAKNPDVKFVPLCLGRARYETCERMGLAIARVLADRSDVLVVVSTDMSHYISAAQARELDTMAIAHVLAVDPKALFDTVVANDISMCGFIPTTVALVAARELGSTQGRLVRYGNSGERSGDYGRVVGYASAVIG